MKVDVVNFSNNIPDEKMNGSVVLLIDVLRCTSCIVTALANGASSVVVFAGVDEARNYAERLGRANCVLGGERHALPIEGYDVGNSPLQYDVNTVSGKTAIMSTTNGAKAISGIMGAYRTLIAAHINHFAAAREAVSLGRDILIICSGTNGEVSADDVVTAGAIVSDIASLAIDVAPTDSAIISMEMYKQFSKGEFDLKSTLHCKRLMSLGENYRADVEYCFRENITDLVPCCVGKTDDGLGSTIR